MLRKLFTLFVFLSGLAAVGAPAQARIGALDEVRLEASSAFSSPCAAARRAAVEHFGKHAPRSVRPAEICVRPTITIRVPTVMLAVDRARE